MSVGEFKPEHLGYITNIFEDKSNYIFRLWEIQKYKEVTEFIKKSCMSDMDIIQPYEIITYKSLVKDSICE